MSKESMGIFLVCLAALLPGALACGSSFTGPMVNVQIPSVCTTFQYGFTTSLSGADAVFARVTSGVFAGVQDHCKVYAGLDNTGSLIGELIRGDTHSAMLVPGLQIFLDCQTNETTSGPSVLIQLKGVTPPKKVTVCGEAPYELKSPGYPENYTNSQRLQWNFVQPVPSMFTFDVTALDTSPDKDFLLIFADGSPLAELHGSLSPFVQNVYASTVTVMFVTTEINANARFLANVTVERSEIWTPIQCDENNITIQIEQRLWECLGYEDNGVDHLYIAESRDVAVDQVNPKCHAIGADTTFNFNLTDCYALFQQDGGIITATFKIWSVAEQDTSLVVQRYTTHHLTAICQYNDSQLVSAAQIIPVIGHVGSALNPVAGAFQTSLTLYDFSNYSIPLLENAQITVPDYIYGEVRLDNLPTGDENTKLQLDFCWATQMQNADDFPSYPIVRDGCKAAALDGEPDDSKAVIRNYMASYARFKFRIFAWTNLTDNEQTVYIHCNMTICQNVTGNCDVLNCAKRKRRSVEYTDSKQLSIGPFHIMQGKNTFHSVAHEVHVPSKEDVNLDDNIINLFSLAILLVAVIVCGCFIYKCLMDKHQYQSFI